MARSENQKLKLLYLMDYLMQHTDEEHPARMGEIISELEKRGISAERKSVYDDIEALRLYGLDIELSGSGRNTGYYVSSRDFELPELKLLVDAVQSSKFITRRKTSALIKKIEKLASVYEAKLLERQVYVSGRIKTMNESIYYNVDEIHSGISENRKIRFRYFDYDVRRERSYRKNGEYYLVSPFALTWDSENYYLIAYDSENAELRHYRVDKMSSISTVDEERDGLEAFRKVDMGEYSRKVFGMFSGREEKVTVRFASHLVTPVLDRLGQDVILVPDGDGFTVTADIAVSPQFFAWITGFGTEARITAPESVVREMREHIASVAAAYSQAE